MGVCTESKFALFLFSELAVQAGLCVVLALLLYEHSDPTKKHPKMELKL